MTIWRWVRFYLAATVGEMIEGGVLTLGGVEGEGGHRFLFVTEITWQIGHQVWF